MTVGHNGMLHVRPEFVLYALLLDLGEFESEQKKSKGERIGTNGTDHEVVDCITEGYVYAHIPTFKF